MDTSFSQTCKETLICFYFSSVYVNKLFFYDEQAHDKTNKITFAPREDSDKPGRTCYFAVSVMLWLSYNA